MHDFTAVRADDLAVAATAVARFRRRRRAVLAGAATVVAVSAIASRALLGPSTSSLVPTDPPPTTAPAVAPSASPDHPVPTVTPPGTGTRAPSTRGSGPYAGVAGTPPQADPRDAAVSPGRRPPFRIHMAQRTVPAGSVTTCPSVNVLCTSSRAAQQKNGSVVLLYRACLNPPRGLWSKRLEFETAREVDFAVVREGRVLWQWSTGQRFAPTPHTLDVDGGVCYEWRTRWTGVLDDGTRPPAGTYTLWGAGRDADGALGRIVSTFTFTR